MTIRKAALCDMEAILEVYRYARRQMRLNGNPDQWGENYPSPEMVENDIMQGNSYVVEEAEEIVGVFAFIPGEDPTYRRIEDGAWLNEQPYGTIHRIAGSGRGKGIFRQCTGFCEARAANVRIDTHERNLIMQHLLEENSYQKCGRIYVADGSPRIAYQKEVKECNLCQPPDSPFAASSTPL